MCGRIWTPPDCNVLWHVLDRWPQLLTYIRLPECGSNISAPRASMGFRPLPPHWLLDISQSYAGPHTRFRKRRCDRFTIRCQIAAIARVRPPYLSRAGRADRIITPVRHSVSDRKHRPVRARPRRSGHSCWQARRPRHWDGAALAASGPTTAWIFLLAGPGENGARSMNEQRAQIESPRLLIPSSRARPPLDCCLGTSPSQAANWRPFLKQR